PIQVERRDLHTAEVEAARTRDEPLGRDHLWIGGGAVEHGDAQAEIVVRVIERRDLLIARALEVSGDRITLPECLRVGDARGRRGRDQPGGGDDESKKERRDAAEHHPRALYRTTPLLPTFHSELGTLARPFCNDAAELVLLWLRRLSECSSGPLRLPDQRWCWLRAAAWPTRLQRRRHRRRQRRRVVRRHWQSSGPATMHSWSRSSNRLLWKLQPGRKVVSSSEAAMPVRACHPSGRTRQARASPPVISTEPSPLPGRSPKARGHRCSRGCC